MDDAIRSWVEETLGGVITEFDRTGSGGSRESYFVSVTTPDGRVVRSVLRLEAGGSFTGTDINVTKEATIYRALRDTPVPVPEVYGLAPGGIALLLERMSGRGDLGDTPEEQHETLVDFVDVIADMHCVDPDSLDLPGFPRPETPEDHARLDLQVWARLADQGVRDLDPLVRYAGAFLIANPPTDVARTAVIQGDTGPGNFVAEHGKVTGLCDMEFSHLGDPMDDIAWMMGRAFGTVPDPAPYLDQYTKRSGIPINRRSVDYYLNAVQYRCAITTSLAVSRGGGARGWPPYLLVTERYVLALAAGLSDYLDVHEPEPALPEVGDTPRTAWYDALMSATRTAVKGISDPDLAENTRNHQILLHYLRAHDRVGAIVDDLNRDDLRRNLGVDGGPDLDAHIDRAGAAGDVATFRALLRCTARSKALWQTLLERPRRS